MASPSSELVDDAITDVLLRLPPEEPAHLVRAALVCRQWRRVVSDRAFLRLYARVHRTPPLLGFFDSYPHYSLPAGHIPRFVAAVPAPMGAASASRFVVSSLAAASPWHVLDCRHGRVLLQRRRRHNTDADDDDGDALNQYDQQLLVWDPVTGDRHELRCPNSVSTSSAADDAVHVVLCAASAAAAAGCCDHSGCRGGAFLVLCAGVDDPTPTDTGWPAYASVYSSELRAWGSSPAHLNLSLRRHGYHSPSLSLDMDRGRRGVVIGHEAYLFRFSQSLLDDNAVLFQTQILKYDTRRHSLSAIDSPDLPGMGTDVQLVETDDGLLGLASVRSGPSCRLCLWSMTAAAEGVASGGGGRWVRRRVIDLRAMSIRMISFANNKVVSYATVIGFAEGVNAVLVSTDDGTFVIDLKSEQARMVCCDEIHNPVVPFMTFYSPGCACGKLPLPV